MGPWAGQPTGPGLNWDPWLGPSRNGLGLGFSPLGLGRAVGRGLFGDPYVEGVEIHLLDVVTTYIYRSMIDIWKS